ncbi:hypothetical protein BT63DRAFT_480137 [Microthyrium microscopicum]|uniref:Uncharacterized protein n=1 Tax=Microthyrium microscopicum TaxID=703497 RepID=A0A6A6UBE1_9PEZI|nr:hypothetical protein BT63DRAFT_480137 [Microthyrium microscopicum]
MSESEDTEAAADMPQGLDSTFSNEACAHPWPANQDHLSGTAKLEDSGNSLCLAYQQLDLDEMYRPGFICRSDDPARVEKLPGNADCQDCALCRFIFQLNASIPGSRRHLELDAARKAAQMAEVEDDSEEEEVVSSSGSPEVRYYRTDALRVDMTGRRGLELLAEATIDGLRTGVGRGSCSTFLGRLLPGSSTSAPQIQY